MDPGEHDRDRADARTDEPLAICILCERPFRREDGIVAEKAAACHACLAARRPEPGHAQRRSVA